MDVLDADKGRIYTSTDGKKWDSQGTGFWGIGAWPHYLNGVTWGTDKFVAVGRAGYVYTSPDGESWEYYNSGISETLNGVFWSNDAGIFVAVGDDGKIITSSNGESGTWVSQSSGVTNRLNNVVWGNTQFVAVGDNGTIILSSDGQSWTTIDLYQQAITTEAVYQADIIDVSCCRGIYVATVDPDVVNEEGNPVLLVSADGINWEEKPVVSGE